jgi:hypothetical protein
MKATLSFAQTKPSTMDHMKYSTLDYIVDYLLTGLESFERDSADSNFQRGYEQALHDTMVDLLRCHMLAKLEAPSLTC